MFEQHLPAQVNDVFLSIRLMVLMVSLSSKLARHLERGQERIDIRKAKDPSDLLWLVPVWRVRYARAISRESAHIRTRTDFTNILAGKWVFLEGPTPDDKRQVVTLGSRMFRAIIRVEEIVRQMFVEKPTHAETVYGFLKTPHNELRV